MEQEFEAHRKMIMGGISWYKHLCCCITPPLLFPSPHEKVKRVGREVSNLGPKQMLVLLYMVLCITTQPGWSSLRMRISVIWIVFRGSWQENITVATFWFPNISLVVCNGNVIDQILWVLNLEKNVLQVPHLSTHTDSPWLTTGYLKLVLVQYGLVTGCMVQYGLVCFSHEEYIPDVQGIL
jgi:hypothetical protein